MTHAPIGALLRASTEKQTTKPQALAIDAWARERGHNLAWYDEGEGVSGALPLTKRPELARLLEDARSRSVEAVVMCEVSRVGRRDAVESFMRICEFWLAGVPLYVLDFDEDEPIDFEDTGDLVRVLLDCCEARSERRRDQARTKRGMAAAIARGVKVGRPGAFYAPEVFLEVQAARAKGVTWKRIAATFTACRRRWVPDAPEADGSPSKSGRWEIVNGAKLDAKQAKAAFRRTGA